MVGVRTSRSVAAALVVGVAALCPAAGEGAEIDAAGRLLVERVYHLEQRSAAAAVDKVCPLLSAHGSVEVQDGGRTLVVRDVEPNVERAMELLAAFDRAGRTVRLVVQIVSADARDTRAVGASAVELPPEVVARLQGLLRYRSYSLLARADLEAVEEVESTYEVGSDFRVSFRLERVGGRERLRMREFRVLRKTGQGDLKPLVHTHLSLETGRPMILGLAPTEASERALMVVLEAEAEEAREARG